MLSQQRSRKQIEGWCIFGVLYVLDEMEWSWSMSHYGFNSLHDCLKSQRFQISVQIDRPEPSVEILCSGEWKGGALFCRKGPGPPFRTPGFKCKSSTCRAMESRVTCGQMCQIKWDNTEFVRYWMPNRQYYKEKQQFVS
jgi:hypothetical protein